MVKYIKQTKFQLFSGAAVGERISNLIHSPYDRISGLWSYSILSIGLLNECTNYQNRVLWQVEDVSHSSQIKENKMGRCGSTVIRSLKPLLQTFTVTI